MEKKSAGGLAIVYASVVLLEAEQARSILEARGIPARVLDGQFVSMQPWLSVWAGGIKVVVQEERRDEAVEVLKDAGFDGGDSQTWPRSHPITRLSAMSAQAI